jgi:hypothetical protein
VLQERTLVQKERSSATYRISSYFAAATVSEVPHALAAGRMLHITMSSSHHHGFVINILGKGLSQMYDNGVGLISAVLFSVIVYFAVGMNDDSGMNFISSVLGMG